MVPYSVWQYVISQALEPYVRAGARNAGQYYSLFPLR